MAKKYQLDFEHVKPVATGQGFCFATDKITVEGHKVGYMYRNDPSDDRDSGWVFMAGQETQEYMDDPANTGIFDVNTIANHDPTIIAFLDAPVGSALMRDPESGEFQPDFGPAESDPDESFEKPKPIMSSVGALAPTLQINEPDPIPDFCDECGRPLDVGEAVIRARTDTQQAGIAAYHRLVHLALCPGCAEQRDGTGDRMIWAMGAFFAIVVAIASIGWLFRWLTS